MRSMSLSDWRVCVQWEVVVEFDDPGVVQLLVYSVLSTSMPVERKTIMLLISNQSINVQVLCSASHWGFWRGIIIMHWKDSQAAGTWRAGDTTQASTAESKWIRTQANILVIVLLFLFSPVFVELVNFHSSISLLYQVKGLCNTKTRLISEHKSCSGFGSIFYFWIYLVNFTKAPSSQKVQEQISFIQCWVIFKSVDQWTMQTENLVSMTAFSTITWPRFIQETVT